MSSGTYVLITAARNEAAYLPDLFNAVTNQTVRPVRWVIVDDNSTDETSKVALELAVDKPFIEFVRLNGRGERDFASQVYAQIAGVEKVKALEYSFIGFLDADIRLGRDYYEMLLARFVEDAKLGVGGGLVVDKEVRGKSPDIRKRSLTHHVAGGVQFFRKECFEDVGGYVPVSAGGQDTIAEVTAAMHGWKVQTFPDLPVFHLRPDGAGVGSAWKRALRWGGKFYSLGYDPIYFVGQSLLRVFESPLLIGSCLQLVGFFKPLLTGAPRAVSPQVHSFLRCSQRKRMIAALKLPGSRTEPIGPSK